MFENRMRDARLGRARQRVRAGIVVDRDLVLLGPMVCCTRFATIIGMFLRLRLACAYSARFSLSAANPTQKGPPGIFATWARMSTVGLSFIASGSPDFLILAADGASGV